MMYSITKECIALNIAETIATGGYKNVVDGCCGAGGNTIACARKGLNVAGVEIEEETLYDCIHNAKIYEVDDKVQYFLGDVLQFDCKKEAGFDPSETFFFSSPEWGGPEYKNKAVFNPEDLNPKLSDLLEYCKKSNYRAACFYLPRTSDINALKESGCVEIKYMYQGGHCDAMTVWYKFS